MALERKGGIRCVSIPDELAMQSAVSFAGAYTRFLESVAFQRKIKFQTTIKHW
jgi:hypothetical protein